MNKQNYFIITLDLDTARSQSQPYEVRTKKDCLFVLSLSGTAQISIDHGEFFPLHARMKILLEKDERKEIEIVNISQPGSLLLFLGSQAKCEIMV